MTARQTLFQAVCVTFTACFQDGKKQIDLNKLGEDDLRKLGIDPTNMSKEEIARALKVRNTHVTSHARAYAQHA